MPRDCSLFAGEGVWLQKGGKAFRFYFVYWEGQIVLSEVGGGGHVIFLCVGAGRCTASFMSTGRQPQYPHGFLFSLALFSY